MMNKSLVKLMYRQLINSSSENSFEKAIWKATYDEFLLKSQAYNKEGKYSTFQQMVANDGRANSLHYKCGFAAAGFMNALQNRIPCLKDSSYRLMPFETYEFKLIDSDISHIQSHQIAIHFITPLLTCYDVIANHLLLSFNTDKEAGSSTLAETFMLNLQPSLSIINYQAL